MGNTLEYRPLAHEMHDAQMRLARVAGRLEALLRYSLTQTGRGSRELGPCEVCGRTCDDLASQSVRRFVDGRWLVDGEHRADAFGHRECLVSLRTEAQ